MSDDQYEAGDDPACYADTGVLINLAGLHDQSALDTFEVEAVARRSHQPPPSGDFDPAHYQALHRHLFQDVYDWAGAYRTIRTAKGASWFCYPEYIEKEMRRLFERLKAPALLADADVDVFVAAAAEFLGDLNAIHPFREGNGRTQLYFLRQIGLRAGHPIRSERVERDAFLHAMIESFACRYDALVEELERMLA